MWGMSDEAYCNKLVSNSFWGGVKLIEAFTNRYFRISVLYALVGMVWGIYMAITEDHSTYPAHAHLLLLGWVSMVIYGVIYRLCPKAAEGTLARIHFWIANAGLVVMIPGVALINSGYDLGEPPAAVGSLITFLAMALFAVTVWRGTAAGHSS
jgi:hypothetical protein